MYVGSVCDEGTGIMIGMDSPESSNQGHLVGRGLGV